MQSSPEWQKLQAHYTTLKHLTLNDFFQNDADRFAKHHILFQDLLLDYSRHPIQDDTKKLLLDLAKAASVDAHIKKMFKGDKVNFTEQRAALHTALRASQEDVPFKDVIQRCLSDLEVFTNAIREHKILSPAGKPYKDIVNIGIGGSHLGPQMAIHALKHFCQKDLRCHFISNVDEEHIFDVLDEIDPANSLFIISSKSFTTIETLTNATTVKKWLAEKCPGVAIAQQFVAITAAKDKALAFGISETHLFPMWDWVGGRYSIWSAIALPLILMIGIDNFKEFLAGARAMDHHFQTAPFENNMPVMAALLGIWHINFHGTNNLAILPYSHRLDFLPMYIQQLDMESNGKQIDLVGNPLSYQTGPIIWGEQGCNGQHAFYQSLHQGTHQIVADFIIAGHPHAHYPAQQDLLVASALSQTQALLQGKETNNLAMRIPGNHSSNVFFLKSITPYNLGMLLAMYEHKVFVQSVIWQINAFDQYGVELGKALLPAILESISGDTHLPANSSIAGLLAYYHKIRA